MVLLALLLELHGLPGVILGILQFPVLVHQLDNFIFKVISQVLVMDVLHLALQQAS